jgi:cell division protein FtsI (penicillin-binding protein 3)
VHPHGWLTFRQAIEQSSNVCAAKTAREIGAERFYKYARNFGLGIATGIELPGEVKGELKKPVEWSGTTLAFMAHGYELSATALQIAVAYSTIANGGVMMQPHVIKREVDDKGNVIQEVYPIQIRRVVSEETAKTTTDILVGVVDRGTGTSAQVEGLKIAGKTGTAQKLVNGKYSKQYYSSSFVGYFPADNPQFLCMVLLDSPKKGYYGGAVAAPIFREITKRIIAVSGRELNPTNVTLNQEEQQKVVVPDVCQLRTEIAKRMLESHGLKHQVFGEGGVVIQQTPESGVKKRRGEIVQLVTASMENAKRGMRTMPDVKGLSVRRAVTRLVIEGLDVRVSGSGIVLGQEPSPGEQIKSGMKCVLRCEPKEIAGARLYN